MPSFELNDKRTTFMFLKIKQLWILGLLLTISCQSYHPLSKHNYFNGHVLYNKPLGIRLEYFGDIVFQPLTEIQKRQVKNFLKETEGIKVRDLVAYGTTNMDPEYEFLLFLKDSEVPEKAPPGIDLTFIDSIQKRVIYSKTDGEKQAFLILKAVGPNNSLGSITNDGLSLMKDFSFDAHLKKELDYSQVFGAIRDNPNYLFARKKLKDAPITESEESIWMRFQFLTTINSFMTDNLHYDELIEEFEGKRKIYLKPILDTVLTKPGITTNADVFKEIADLSMQTQVVMLNENHWYPKHRQLALALLRPLKEKGYSYLALEALFQDQDTDINTRGYPIFDSGYYTREANFGHLIRTATEMGFEILDYENYDNEIDRELGQAMNLAAIFRENPAAKVFVYAGLDHIIEEPTKRGRSMAVHFKNITGIDPLTINQAELVSETAYNLVALPFELLKENEKLRKKPVDLLVINNLNPDENSLYSAMALKKIVIEDENLRRYAGEDLLIKVYKLIEYERYRSLSIPIFSTIKRVSPDNQFVIALPPGDYKLRVMSGEDDKVILKEINL